MLKKILVLCFSALSLSVSLAQEINNFNLNNVVLVGYREGFALRFGHNSGGISTVKGDMETIDANNKVKIEPITADIVFKDFKDKNKNLINVNVISLKTEQDKKVTNFIAVAQLDTQGNVLKITPQ